MIKRRRMLQSLGTASVISVTGCTGTGNGNGDGSDELDSLKIGLLVPETGAYGSIGVPFGEGASVAIDAAREKSEVLADVDIEVESRNTESDPDSALNVAEELVIQEEVDFLLGCANSQAAGVVGRFANNENVIYNAGMTATAEITHGESCSKYVNRFTPSTYAGPQVLPTFAVDEIGPRGYVLYPDYTTGYQHRDLAPPTIEELGGEVAGVTPAPLGNEDYSSILGDISEQDPDWIFCGMMGSGALPFYKQAASRGIEVPILGNLIISEMSAGLTLDELDQLGDLYRFARYTREIPTDKNEEFVERFIEAHDQPPTFAGGQGIQAANMMLTAYEKAGTKDPDGVSEAVRGMEWDALNGPAQVRECDNQAAMPVYVARITGHSDQYELGTNEIVREHDINEFYPDCEDVACDMDA